MQIRHYSIQDSTVVYQLFVQTIQSINSSDYTSPQIQAWIGCTNEQKLHNKLQNSYSLVALIDNVIVGFGNIKDNHLDCLYVHHQFQHQGIATALCDKLESTTLSPITVEASISAQDFFLKRGYTCIKQQAIPLSDQILTNFLMVKNIT